MLFFGDRMQHCQKLVLTYGTQCGLIQKHAGSIKQQGPVFYGLQLCYKIFKFKTYPDGLTLCSY
jgi:hypothetical protein